MTTNLSEADRQRLRKFDRFVIENQRPQTRAETLLALSHATIYFAIGLRLSKSSPAVAEQWLDLIERFAGSTPGVPPEEIEIWVRNLTQAFEDD